MLGEASLANIAAHAIGLYGTMRDVMDTPWPLPCVLQMALRLKGIAITQHNRKDD